jgi:putative phage-type endonuclease
MTHQLALVDRHRPPATVVMHRRPTTPQLRAWWLAQRRRGLTASEIPAILGLSEWSTPLDVWLKKVRPEQDLEVQAYRFDRGHALEPVLAAEWHAQTGDFIEEPPALVAHPEDPRILCSLDYLAHSPDATRVLELKTSSTWEPWADGDLPDKYAAQVQIQLEITDLDEGIVFADVNGRLETRRIPRDRAWARETIDLALAWWDAYVTTGTPPPLDPIRDYPNLNRVWIPEPGTEAWATPEVLAALRVVQKLREAAKHRDNITKELKTQVRAHMRTATILRDPDTGDKVASIDSRGALLVSATPLREEGTHA